MIEETFRAALQAGVPIFIVSFALVWWAGTLNYFQDFDSVESLEKEIKRMTESEKQKKKRLKRIPIFTFTKNNARQT